MLAGARPRRQGTMHSDAPTSNYLPWPLVRAASCEKMQSENPVFASERSTVVDLEVARKAGMLSPSEAVELMEAQLETQAEKVRALEAKLEAFVAGSSHPLDAVIRSAVARLTEAPT